MTNSWFELLNHPNDIRTIVLPDIPDAAKELDRYSDDGILFGHPRYQSMRQPSGIIGFPGRMG